MASRTRNEGRGGTSLIVFIPRNHILVLGMAVTIVNCAGPGTLKHNGFHVVAAPEALKVIGSLVRVNWC